MREKRKPSFFLAILPIILMIALLGVGYAVWGLRAEILMLISAVIAGVIAYSLGYSWDEIMDEIVSKLSSTMPAIFILIMVGALIGSWVAGGTIPLMIYYGLKLINPEYIFVTSLIITSVISLATGTSWGSAGTIGVALMGVAAGIHAPLPIVAGAVVSGAYFGDKMSPLSDTTNLAPIAAGSKLYDHIQHMLWTTVPGYIVAIIVFWIAGTRVDMSHAVGSDAVASLLNSLDQLYAFNFWILLPPIIVLLGSIMKWPTIPVMILSIIFATANALIVQKIDIADSFEALISGFNLEMISLSADQIANLHEDIPNLLERGGMLSMLNTVLIAFCAYAFAGTISVTNSLDIVLEKLMSNVRGTFQLVATTIVATITTIFVTSNGQLSLLLPGEMFGEVYIKEGLEPKNLSRTLEDSATVVEPIVPWTAAGHYMATTLGVATLDYLPWAILCYSGVIFALIWAMTGIGIKKIDSKSDYYNEYLKLNQKELK